MCLVILHCDDKPVSFRISRISCRNLYPTDSYVGPKSKSDQTLTLLNTDHICSTSGMVAHKKALRVLLVVSRDQLYYFTLAAGWTSVVTHNITKDSAMISEKLSILIQIQLENLKYVLRKRCQTFGFRVVEKRIVTPPCARGKMGVVQKPNYMGHRRAMLTDFQKPVATFISKIRSRITVLCQEVMECQNWWS